jgi:hypothetical protein
MAQADETLVILEEGTDLETQMKQFGCCWSVFMVLY